MKELIGVKKNIFLKVLFLIVGFLAVLEFTIIRGMFTWIIAVAAVILTGIINVINSFRNSNYLDAALYILCVTGICMGYFAFA